MPGYRLLLFLPLSMLPVLIVNVHGLRCQQCARLGLFATAEQGEQHRHLCQLGLFQPSGCPNETSTHCIVSYFRHGDTSKKTVTERRCGVESDITGCTTYNPRRLATVDQRFRLRRHLLDTARVDQRFRMGRHLLDTATTYNPRRLATVDQRFRRHLLDTARVRKNSSPRFVEVCQIGCLGRDCVSSGIETPGRGQLLVMFWLLVSICTWS